MQGYKYVGHQAQALNLTGKNSVARLHIGLIRAVYATISYDDLYPNTFIAAQPVLSSTFIFERCSHEHAEFITYLVCLCKIGLPNKPVFSWNVIMLLSCANPPKQVCVGSMVIK